MDSECDDYVARALTGNLTREEARVDWSLPVKFASDCSVCPDCGDPWCDECDCHYVDCKHPGPHSELEDGQPPCARTTATP